MSVEASISLVSHLYCTTGALQNDTKKLVAGIAVDGTLAPTCSMAAARRLPGGPAGGLSLGDNFGTNGGSMFFRGILSGANYIGVAGMQYALSWNALFEPMDTNNFPLDDALFAASQLTTDGRILCPADIR